MKKLIAVAVLMIMFVACKKKDVKPEPEPDPVPVCQTGYTLFPGTYTDQNGSKITIVFLNNNCPTKNSNTYRIDGLAAAINANRPGTVYYKNEYTMKSMEYGSGFATMSATVGDFAKAEKETNITYSGTGGTLYFKKE